MDREGGPLEVGAEGGGTSVGLLTLELGEVPMFIVMTALFVQWRRSDEKDAARYDRNAERDHDAELEAYNAMLAARGNQGMTAEEREY